MKACFVCGRKSPDSAVACSACHWPLSPRGYWSYRLSQGVLTLVLVPLVLWMVSAMWQRAQQRQVAHEELEKAQTTLLDTITQRMEGFIALRTDLWNARTALDQMCLLKGQDGQSPTVACEASYVKAIDTMDRAVVDVSWRIDSLPVISPESYGVLTSFKDQYWKSCKDEAPIGECGYRQRSIRLVHGINVPAAAALKACIGDTSAPACRNARALMASTVLKPLDLEANAFFCMVAADVKNARIAVAKRRSAEMDGDRSLDDLTARLEANLKASACSAIVSEWVASHGQPPS